MATNHILQSAEKWQFDNRLNERGDSIRIIETMLVLMHVFDGSVGVLPTVEPIQTQPVEQAPVSTPVTETYEATAYIALCDTGCTGKTATGVDVRNTIYSEGYRVIATDPDVIALGSIVRITLADGSNFEAIAADVGGAINGHDIDLLVASESEAWEFGRQAVEIEVIRYGAN